MLEEGLQLIILKHYYSKWMEEIRNIHSINGILDLDEVDVDERTLHANADYLVDKGLIDKPRTMAYETRIAILGIIEVDSRELPPDYKDRRKLLEYLKEYYDEHPDKQIPKGILAEKLEIEEEKVERIVWYHDKLGYVDALWYGGGFNVNISSSGIDYLVEPTELDYEKEVMANAYKLLYELENRLRFYYERVLREEFAEKWWEKGVPNKIRPKAEENKDKENGNFSLMHYTDFEDLRLVPQRNWELFKPALKTQQGITSRLNELEPIRHKIAHTRLLTNDEIAKLQVFHKEILRMLEET